MPQRQPEAAAAPQQPYAGEGPPPAPGPDKPRRRKWNVTEFMRMIELRLISGRVDLVDGEVIEMPAAMGDKHTFSIDLVLRWLYTNFPQPYFIHSQATHRFAEELTREPDAAVMPRPLQPGQVLHDLPLLVIEVGDDSLHFDLTVKRLEYARMGVPEYWVIDIPHRRVRVFREPDGAATDPEKAYRVDLILDGAVELRPLCRAEARTTPNALLPPAGF